MFTILSKTPGCKTIVAYSRKELPLSEKSRPIISKDSSDWPSKYPQEADLFISALGTSRARAGGFDNQRKIDYDFNLELAKAAKAAGTKVYTLISSSGADSSSMFGYMKMKGELEDAVKALDFDRCIIVRPGLIVGPRENPGLAEFGLKKIAGLADSLSPKLKDFWAQDAETIGKAAVKAGLDAVEGKEMAKFTILAQADIVRLGKTEWKD